MSSWAQGQNLTYGIANDLGIAIVTGVYSADDPIPIEAELCRKFGASRSVLREAVKMLTAKGLLGALASIADHKKVADAIQAGKEALAREAMHRLIQEALDLISKREAAQVSRRSPKHGLPRRAR